MAEKSRGNLKYEIAIAALVIALIFTITYPSSVWKHEAELQNFCRSRMEAIQQLELRYVVFNNSYSDSLPAVIDTVLANPGQAMSLDSVINWEGLLPEKQLKKIVMAEDFPRVIRDYMLTKFEKNEPLGNLAHWDSLNYKLIAGLEAVLALDDSMGMKAVTDTSINWMELMNRTAVLNIVNNSGLPRGVQRKTNTQLRDEVPMENTAAWTYLDTVFYDTLQSMLVQACRKDVWTKDNKEKWEGIRKKQWEADMDTLSKAGRDSIWAANSAAFWNKEKEVIWKKERKSLRKKELKTWKEKNTSTWHRIADQMWRQERRKKWYEETPKNKKLLYDLLVKVPEPETESADTVQTDTLATAKGLTENMEEPAQPESPMSDVTEEPDTMVMAIVFPDSVKEQPFIPYKDLSKDSLKALIESLRAEFEIKKDSLWRRVVGDLRDKEFDKWMKKNKKELNDKIQQLWEQDRRVSWDEERYKKWLKEQEANPDKLWKKIKDELWRSGIDREWKTEEDKLSHKLGAQRKLDLSINWENILGADYIKNLVEGLDLPKTKAIWEKIKNYKGKGSALNKLGIAGIFRNQLIQFIYKCPVAKVDYQIHVVDTLRVKQFDLACPIVDTTKHTYALDIDPVTKDTTKVKLRVGLFKKLFGGGSIKNHGNINKLGKSSWDQRSR